MQLITHDQVKSRIIQLRNQSILLDSDVAELYGVETKRINEAVKRNPEKFPEGYIIELDSKELESMRSQIATASKRNVTNTPKAFTESGLYMLATILKSPTAVNTTIAIIDTFRKFKEVTQAVYEMGYNCTFPRFGLITNYRLIDSDLPSPICTLSFSQIRIISFT